MNSFCSICFVCQTRTPILIAKRHQSERLHSWQKSLSPASQTLISLKLFRRFREKLCPRNEKRWQPMSKKTAEIWTDRLLTLLAIFSLFFFLQGLIYHLNSSYRCIMAVPEDGTRKILHKKEGKQLWQPSLFTNVLILFNKESHPPSPC